MLTKVTIPLSRAAALVPLLWRSSREAMGATQSGPGFCCSGCEGGEERVMAAHVDNNRQGRARARGGPSGGAGRAHTCVQPVRRVAS